MEAELYFSELQRDFFSFFLLQDTIAKFSGSQFVAEPRGKPEATPEVLTQHPGGEKGTDSHRQLESQSGFSHACSVSTLPPRDEMGKGFVMQPLATVDKE